MAGHTKSGVFHWVSATRDSSTTKAPPPLPLLGPAPAALAAPEARSVCTASIKSLLVPLILSLTACSVIGAPPVTSTTTTRCTTDVGAAGWPSRRGARRSMRLMATGESLSGAPPPPFFRNDTNGSLSLSSLLSRWPRRSAAAAAADGPPAAPASAAAWLSSSSGSLLLSYPHSAVVIAL